MRTRAKTAAGAAIVVVLGTVIGAPLASSGAASGNANVVDYSQCADSTGSSAGCPGGWINGILNASNSSYYEDEVVPQRAVLSLTAGSPVTGRTISLRYQARKSGKHAYDSLATWNHTQAAADPCAGLSGSDCVGGAPSTFPIPDDSTNVQPATLNGSATTAHMIAAGAGRRLTMYGGTITAMSPPVHDNAATAAGDDWATVTITYAVADTTAARNVMLLFGGHLSAGLGSRGWGSGIGASSISGGPYHIKLDLTDGASVGNRDNQIQGAAIGFPAISTVPSPGGNVGTMIFDTATVSGGNSPTGTVTFSLYPPADPTCDGTPVYQNTVPLLAGVAATSESYQTLEAGTYRWVAVYNGDGKNTPVAGGCDDEQVLITEAVVTPPSPEPSVEPFVEPSIEPFVEPSIEPTQEVTQSTTQSGDDDPIVLGSVRRRTLPRTGSDTGRMLAIAMAIMLIGVVLAGIAIRSEEEEKGAMRS